VIWLVEALADDGARICVISRGYGRPNAHDRLMVSDGMRVLAGADQAGDEAVLLAESLLGRAAVLCDRDRAAAAEWAVENLGSNLIFLDDGFQHFRLGRTVDLVIIDASRPFAGLMRESVKALRQADAIVLTRSDLARDLPGLMKSLTRASLGRPVFIARTQAAGFRRLNADQDADDRPEPPIGAFCGIGNPWSFFALLEHAGFAPVYERAFRDHANYDQPMIDEVCRAATTAGARALITTAKDEVKLRDFRFALPTFVSDTKLEIDGQDRLLAMLRGRIAPELER
jgi:tetraacyldisaccharide 4'-kinase